MAIEIAVDEDLTMADFSVADAKNNLPRLIDRALEGEEVVITRRGKPVVELRPVATPKPEGVVGTHAWLRARRRARPRLDMTTTEIMDLLREDYRY
jgi:prevent-host-death family protein